MRDMTASSQPEASPPPHDATHLIGQIVANVAQVFVGKDEVAQHAVLSMVAGGHVLLEDVPGVGKTLLAKSLARSFDADFKRIQFTADLLPSDVTGVTIYSQDTNDFHFRPGPLFANIVLGDETNLD